MQMTKTRSFVVALFGLLVGTLTIDAAGGALIEGVQPAGGGDRSQVDGLSRTYRSDVLTAAASSLTITRAGSGTGSVTGDVGLINCGAICVDTYVNGTPITLTATPSSGNLFTGWLGPCTGFGTCQFTINGTTNAVATFAPASLGAPGLDADGTGSFDALTDGLLILRYLFGLTGPSLINGAIGSGAARATATEVESYLTDIKPALDIDGNGQVDALTDGLLIIRYLFGVRGASLIAGAVAANAIRTNTTDIETQLQSLHVNFPQTADSISVIANGTRNDPEGIATTANVNRVVWKDSRGADRSMILGGYLYQYDFTFNDNVQIVTRSANDSAYGHPGFGYVVSHNTVNSNSPIGKANIPSVIQTRVLTGGHHALHHVELLYDRDKETGGNGIKIPVVIEWLVATGRDHPVWAVTWKVGHATNPSNTDFSVYQMDTRGPYGSLNYDGAANSGAGDIVGGVAWGDAGFAFTTTDSQLTMNSPWTYDTSNTVNYVRSWTKTVNAEMGIVQTKPLDKEMGYGDRVVGRERGATSALAYLNKGDCNGFGDSRIYVMPCVSGWPYQLMNFDWDPFSGKPLGEATSTKLTAWGSSYGWLGSSSFSLFDFSATADGRGDRSYATFIVLGPKNRYNAVTTLFDLDGDVAQATRAVEALAAATITAVIRGAVATLAPRGPGATDTKSLVNGYNDTRTAFELIAAGNQVSFTFTPVAGKPVQAPIFVVHNYTSGMVPTINIGGAGLTVNTGAPTSGAFVSLDQTSQELWVTLNSTITAATTVQITSP